MDIEHIVPFDDRFRHQTAYYQLILVAVLAGIAMVPNDAQVRVVVGEMSSVAYTAAQLLREVAEAVHRAARASGDHDTHESVEANVLADARSAQTQVVLSESVPRAATLVFNTLGASATSRAIALDRHWRNARTVGSHNPMIYKAGIVGVWSINGTPPLFIWQIARVRATG